MLSVEANFLSADAYAWFADIHTSVLEKDAQIASPRHFIKLINSFRSIFNKKRGKVTERQKHLKVSRFVSPRRPSSYTKASFYNCCYCCLQNGVSKLNEAKNVVNELESKANEQRKKLSQKQSEADAALNEITKSMQGAGEQKIEMEELKVKIEAENKKLAKRKAEIEEELKDVQPIVDEAKRAVGQIKADSLSEIRALRAPPDAVRDILEGVLRLMGNLDTSWSSIKNFLGKRGIKEEIINFNPRTIGTENRESVEKLLKKNAESFEPENAKRASAAAAPLSQWVKANVQFSKILEKIVPLEAEQDKLKRSLEKVTSKMSTVGSELSKVDDRVALLRKTFEQTTTEAARLKIELEKAEETTRSAQNLLDKLESEHHRWNTQVAELQRQLDQLPKLSLLSAAFITYLSSKPEDERVEYLRDWLAKLAMDAKSFDMRRFLCNESELLTWKAEGLPSDQLSIENSIVILEAIDH